MTRALLFALLAGCAATTSYVYAPRDASTSQDGYPAAIVPVPPEAPKGRLELVSYGVMGSSLHVRITVQNDSDSHPWTLVPSEQLVEMGSRPAVRPSVATSGAFPVASGERLTVDLYYPLPPGVSGEGDLPGFDLLWRLGASSARAHFQRIEEDKLSTQFHPIYTRSQEPYWF